MNTKTISLELAKKLHDTCIKFNVKEIKNEYYWTKHETQCDEWQLTTMSIGLKNGNFKILPAPDCSELGVALTAKYTITITELDVYHCFLEFKLNESRTETGKTLAECMGKMYLWLVLNRYIK